MIANCLSTVKRFIHCSSESSIKAEHLRFRNELRNEQGAALIEDTLAIALLTVALISSVMFLSMQVSSSFAAVASEGYPAGLRGDFDPYQKYCAECDEDLPYFDPYVTAANPFPDLKTAPAPIPIPIPKNDGWGG